MLVCALLARLTRVAGRADFAQRVVPGLDYTLSRQRADGSWLYGEANNLNWVDGFHTGYVLDSLLTCICTGIGTSAAEDAWRRGLRFLVRRLIEEDGTPRYSPDSRYPVDGQCVAQAIHTLARAAPFEPELAARRWKVLSYALRRMARSDGAFVFQRLPLWVNRTAHPRWVEAPMLAAMTELIATA